MKKNVPEITIPKNYSLEEFVDMEDPFIEEPNLLQEVKIKFERG